MPIFTTIGAASSRGFGLFGGAADTGPYWIGQAYSGVEDVGGGVAADASGNVYLSGYTKPGAGNENMLLMKLNSTGSVQWQRTLSGTGSDIAYVVKYDAAGDVYIGGNALIGANACVELAKYDSSGALVWQRYLTNASFTTNKTLALDASGSLYVACISGTSGIVIKVSSAGSILWQTSLTNGTSFGPTGIDVDASGNVAVAATSSSGATYIMAAVLLNSSGVVQWQRLLTNTSTVEAGGCAIDTSGNVYISGSASNGSVFYGVTAKYNSSGTLQWQRKVGSATNNIHWLSLALDPERNVYVAGYDTYTYPDDKAMFAKYDQYGNLLLQRSVSSSTVDAFVGITAPTGTAVYLNGYSAARGTADLLFAKLPKNGSLTGTYSVGGYSFTYAATTVTEAAGTYTDAAGSFTSSAGAFTIASSSLTSATSGLSSAVTTI